MKDKLFNEFPPVSKEQWEAVIREDLKGDDYEKKLVWKTNEGIKVKPYYTAEDHEKIGYLSVLPGEYPFVRGSKTRNNEWYIRQDIDVINVAEANTKALDILSRGVTSIGFIIHSSVILNEQNIGLLFNGICLTAIEVNLSVGKRAPGLMPLVLKYMKEKKYNLSELRGAIEFDPLGCLTGQGRYCFESEQKSFDAAKEIILASKEIPEMRMITVRGSLFSNAGSSIVQELAFALAMGSDYLSRLLELGLSVKEIAGKIKFKFGISSNYFMEIAKFRAARLLWAKIVEAYDPNSKVIMNIHAETISWNMTVYDSFVNILRSTSEAMSAGIAGIDSMTVIPYNSIYEPANKLSERIARNTQIILQEESYMDKVIDPSAGSYYIESLTDAIISEGWKLFCEVESKGGYIAAFKSGFVQSRIKEVAQKRELNIATRREVLLGTNQYPDWNEKRNSAPLTEERCSCSKDRDSVAESLKIIRGSAAFEEIRLKTDLSGKTPKVFMLTIGHLAMRLARSQFACNFFACAGFEVIDNKGFKTIEEGVKEAISKKADIVVLCSSDEEYATLAPVCFENLGNKAIFVVAGLPACAEELKAKGIKYFIHVRSDMLETLKEFQKILKMI